MKLPELGIIALTPAAWTGNDFHPGIAIAAARAGAIGVLDLEYIDEAGGAELALDKLIAEAGAGGVGIRCGAEQVDAFETLIAKLAAANAASKMLILATRDKDLDKKAISHCAHLAEKKHLLLAVEAINLDEAKLAQQAGAHLVIAKGHESAGRVGQETSFVLLQRLCSELDLPVWVRGGIGPHTAAAALAAGCAGVVLDSQLLLLRESPLSVEQKEKISNRAPGARHAGEEGLVDTDDLVDCLILSHDQLSQIVMKPFCFPSRLRGIEFCVQPDHLQPP